MVYAPEATDLGFDPLDVVGDMLGLALCWVACRPFGFGLGVSPWACLAVLMTASETWSEDDDCGRAADSDETASEMAEPMEDATSDMAFLRLRMAAGIATLFP